MSTSNIEISTDLVSDINEVSEQLGITANQTVQLAIQSFLQSKMLSNTIEGLSRIQDGTELVDFPELEEVGIELKFHPKAMEELEVLEEDEQIGILEDILHRVSSEENDEDMLDLVIKEDPTFQTVISEFSFGDVVYQLGNEVIIYHIANFEEDDEDEEDGEGDDDDFDDEEHDETEDIEEDETEAKREEEKF